MQLGLERKRQKASGIVALKGESKNNKEKKPTLGCKVGKAKF